MIDHLIKIPPNVTKRLAASLNFRSFSHTLFIRFGLRYLFVVHYYEACLY